MCRHGTNYKVGKQAHSKTDIAFNILMIGSTWRWLLHLTVPLNIPASNQNTLHTISECKLQANLMNIMYIITRKFRLLCDNKEELLPKTFMNQQNTNLYKHILMIVLQRTHTKTKETDSKLQLSVGEYEPRRDYHLSESLGIRSVHHSS